MLIRSRHPNTMLHENIELVTQLMNTVQCVKATGKTWNDHLNDFLIIIGIK